jgi:hypothetical protein
LTRSGLLSPLTLRTAEKFHGFRDTERLTTRLRPSKGGDAAFRDEALDEILRMQSDGCRPGPEVWRGWGRRLAAGGYWAGALCAFAAPATPVPSLPAPDLVAQACLLRLAGDDEGTKRIALEVRGLPERLLFWQRTNQFATTSRSAPRSDRPK